MAESLREADIISRKSVAQKAVPSCHGESATGFEPMAGIAIPHVGSSSLTLPPRNLHSLVILQCRKWENCSQPGQITTGYAYWKHSFLDLQMQELELQVASILYLSGEVSSPCSTNLLLTSKLVGDPLNI